MVKHIGGSPSLYREGINAAFHRIVEKGRFKDWFVQLPDLLGSANGKQKMLQ